MAEAQVAVIIPVYKAHETIKQTLYSVFMQRHITYEVYMIVDGEEPDSYDYLLDIFPTLNIFYLDTNVGPGVARQYGIDNSTEPYISFIDADDTYLSSLALFYQHKPFDNSDKCVMVSCDFLEEKKDHSVRLRERDMVWMHGKMYKRAFLDKYQIRFNDTRANEDVGFNTQCQCFANENEQVNLAKDVTYLWQWREDSTVRTDNHSYSFNESIDGYVINKIYAFKRVIEVNGVDEPIQYFIMKGMAHMFRKYLLAMLKAPKQLTHVKKWARKYYRSLYKYITEEYREKAEKTILAQSGLNKVEHYDEFVKFKKLLERKKRK